MCRDDDTIPARNDDDVGVWILLFLRVAVVGHRTGGICLYDRCMPLSGLACGGIPLRQHSDSKHGCLVRWNRMDAD